MTDKELLKAIREKKDKPKFSKGLVTLMILMAISYTIAHLYIFFKVGEEPVTIAKLFFSFVTIELGYMAGLKVVELRKAKKGDDD